MGVQFGPRYQKACHSGGEGSTMAERLNILGTLESGTVVRRC
jgi:hypothetical protein